MIVSFDSSELVSLVSSIALLTAAQQAVFLHCLKFNPNPAYYSGDERPFLRKLRADKSARKTADEIYDDAEPRQPRRIRRRKRQRREHRQHCH